MKQVLTHYVDKVADKVKIRNQRTLNPSDLVPCFTLREVILVTAEFMIFYPLSPDNKEETKF